MLVVVILLYLHALYNFRWLHYKQVWLFILWKKFPNRLSHDGTKIFLTQPPDSASAPSKGTDKSTNPAPLDT